MSVRLEMNSLVTTKRPSKSKIPKPIAYIPSDSMEIVRGGSPPLYAFLHSHFVIKEPKTCVFTGVPLGQGSYNKIFSGRNAKIGSKRLSDNEIFRISLASSDPADPLDLLEFVSSFVTWGVGHEKGICPPIKSMGYCTDADSGDTLKMMVTHKCEGDLASVGDIPNEGKEIYDVIDRTAKAGLMLLDIKPQNMLLCNGQVKMTDLDADWAYVESRRDTDKVLEKLRKWVMCTLYMGHESRTRTDMFKNYVKQKASHDLSFKIEMNTYTEQVKGLANKYLQGEEWMYRGVTIPPQAVEGLVQHYFHQPQVSPSSDSETPSMFGSLETSSFAGTISESDIRMAQAMMASLKKKLRRKFKKKQTQKRHRKQRKTSKNRKTRKKRQKKTRKTTQRGSGDTTGEEGPQDAVYLPNYVDLLKKNADSLEQLGHTYNVFCPGDEGTIPDSLIPYLKERTYYNAFPNETGITSVEKDEYILYLTDLAPKNAILHKEAFARLFKLLSESSGAGGVNIRDNLPEMMIVISPSLSYKENGVVVELSLDEIKSALRTIIASGVKLSFNFLQGDSIPELNKAIEEIIKETNETNETGAAEIFPEDVGIFTEDFQTIPNNIPADRAAELMRYIDAPDTHAKLTGSRQRLSLAKAEVVGAEVDESQVATGVAKPVFTPGDVLGLVNRHTPQRPTRDVQNRTKKEEAQAEAEEALAAQLKHVRNARLKKFDNPPK